LRAASAFIFLLASSLISAQISPEDHARHHPGQSATTPTGSPAQPGSMGSGMMEGMGEMMRGMHGTPPKQLYPTLMSLPSLSAEQRQQVEQQANERMQSGTAFDDASTRRIGAGRSRWRLRRDARCDVETS
jgi:hypothetical protein